FVQTVFCFFFVQAEDGIRDRNVTGVQTCALPILGISYVLRSSLTYDLTVLSATFRCSYLSSNQSKTCAALMSGWVRSQFKIISLYGSNIFRRTFVELTHLAIDSGSFSK